MFWRNLEPGVQVKVGKLNGLRVVGDVLLGVESELWGDEDKRLFLWQFREQEVGLRALIYFFIFFTLLRWVDWAGLQRQGVSQRLAGGGLGVAALTRFFCRLGDNALGKDIKSPLQILQGDGKLWFEKWVEKTVSKLRDKWVYLPSSYSAPPWPFFAFLRGQKKMRALVKNQKLLLFTAGV